MKTNNLQHLITIFSSDGEEKTNIQIRLSDEGRNGHEDFAITADLYRKAGNNRWVDAGGGCCHERILALRPDLKPFVDLHLCTFEGVPMHAFANAWYWFQGAFPEAINSQYHGGSGSSAKPPVECLRIFTDHILATPEQVQQVAVMMPRSQEELQAVMEDMGFPEMWRTKAQAAIHQLEEWTGSEFESQATRGRWEPLSPETRQLIARRRASGYYTPEAVAARDAEERKVRREKRVASLVKDYEAKTSELRQDHAFAVWCAQNYDQKPNAIRYSDGRIAANWTSTEKLFTRDEWEEFTRRVPADLFDAPPVFVFQERPKY